jgi:hypothetical protein
MPKLEAAMETRAEALLNDIVLLNRELLEQITGMNLFIKTFTSKVGADDYLLIKRIQDSLNASKDRPLDVAQFKATIFALGICEQSLRSHADEPGFGPDRAPTLKSQETSLRSS